MDNQFKILLENECSPFVNPMGAISTHLNNKVQQGRESLNWFAETTKAMEAEKKLAGNSGPNSSPNSNSDNGSGSNDPLLQKKTPMEVLSIGGINKEDLSKMDKIFSEVNKLADIGRNYGAESTSDFLSRIAAVQTYFGHKGIPSGGGEACNIVASIFNVSMGLGKQLLGLIGVDLTSLNEKLSKLKGWVEEGVKFTSRAVDMAQRILQEFSDIKSFIDNIDQHISDIKNQLKNAIQSEIDKLNEILAYNARMALASFLGPLSSDPCVGKVINSISSDSFKRLF